RTQFLIIRRPQERRPPELRSLLRSLRDRIVRRQPNETPRWGLIDVLARPVLAERPRTHGQRVQVCTELLGDLLPEHPVDFRWLHFNERTALDAECRRKRLWAQPLI